MSAESITKQDLSELRLEILREIRKFTTSHQPPGPQKLLRSNDVKALLRISSGTLQTLRENGAISFRKIGGTFYYPYDEIQKLLQPDKNQKN